jgi:hypothetical protein
MSHPTVMHCTPYPIAAIAVQNTSHIPGTLYQPMRLPLHMDPVLGQQFDYAEQYCALKSALEMEMHRIRGHVPCTPSRSQMPVDASLVSAHERVLSASSQS